MPLIVVPQHSREDLEVWRLRERADALNAQRTKFRVRVRDALSAMRDFAEQGPCYAGVSWGKDSTVIADLVSQLRREGGPTIPLCWVRAEPRTNPHCELVRDAWRAMPEHREHPYEEIESWCVRRDDGAWSAGGTLERGLAQAASRYSDRHVSGVRGDESGARHLRMMRFGVSTERTCAPIGWWSAQDVWAYLYARELPIHPAYAMSMDGRIERDRLRVATLGGRRGDGWGRATWEWRYYGWRLDQIGHRQHDVRHR